MIVFRCQRFSVFLLQPFHGSFLLAELPGSGPCALAEKPDEILRIRIIQSGRDLGHGQIGLQEQAFRLLQLVLLQMIAEGFSFFRLEKLPYV